MKEETILAATGKSKEKWCRILDDWGGTEKEHKSIAQFLQNEHQLSAWWAQEITVLYEKQTGQRVLGQPQDGLFQIGVRKTIPASASTLWNYILSDEAGRLFLEGSPAEGRPENWHSEQGAALVYQMSTFRPHSHFRMKWQRSTWEQASILQVRVIAKTDNKSILSIHQEKIPREQDRTELQTQWKAIAEKIASRFRH